GIQSVERGQGLAHVIKPRREGVGRRPDLVVGRDRRQRTLRLQRSEPSRQLRDAIGDALGPEARRDACTQRVDGGRALGGVRRGAFRVDEEAQALDRDDALLAQGLEELPILVRRGQDLEMLTLGEMTTRELSEQEVVGLVADLDAAHQDGAVLQIAVEMAEALELSARQDEEAGRAVLEVEAVVAEAEAHVPAGGAALAGVDVEVVEEARRSGRRRPARHRQKDGDAEQPECRPSHFLESYPFWIAVCLSALFALPAGARRSLKVSTSPWLACACPSPSPMAAQVPRFSSHFVTPPSFPGSPTLFSYPPT